MSTAHKVILIVATSLVTIGMMLCLGAFAGAGFTFKGLSTDARDWTPTTHVFSTEAQGAHTSLTVHDPAGSVRFEKTDGDAIEVTYWESTEERKSFAIADDNGAITVEGSQVGPWSGHVGFMVNMSDRTTVVKVPQSFAGAIATDYGSVNVANAENLDELLTDATNAREVPEAPEAPEMPEPPEAPSTP